MNKYVANPVVVDAIKFDGGEAAARKVIDWVSSVKSPVSITAVRHLHKDSWNDSTETLWIEVRAVGARVYLEPGCWLVIDEYGDVDALAEAEFTAEYTPAVQS